MFDYEAVATKCRAMAGRLLTKEQFALLGAKDTLPEFSAALQNTEAYGDAFNGEDISSIHRRRLEELLQKNLYNIYIKLFNFADGNLKKFIGLLTENFELNALIAAIRALKAEPVVRLSAVPGYIIKHSKLPFEAISACESYDKILSLLKGSFYYEPSFIYLNGKEQIDFTSLDVSLSNAYYKRLYTKGAALCANNEDIVKRTVVAKARAENKGRRERLERFGIKNYEPYLINIPGSLKETQESLPEFAKRLMLNGKPNVGTICGFLLLKQEENKKLVNIIEKIRYGKID